MPRSASNRSEGCGVSASSSGNGSTRSTCSVIWCLWLSRQTELGCARGGAAVNSFDYLFSFYGLLLGIAVANVAIGFADMWRDSGKIGVGYCPPLLGLVVMLGGMNVWLTMWHLRGAATVDAW